MPRSDAKQAAYFALLRAREEVDGLRRYEEYLVAERARLDAFAEAGRKLDEEVDTRLRRALKHTDGPIGEALELRRRVIADERARLPGRVEAAEEYVRECEATHASIAG